MGITGITEFYDTVIPKKSKINFVSNEHHPPPNEPEQRTKIADRTMMSTLASNDNQPHSRRHDNTLDKKIRRTI